MSGEADSFCIAGSLLVLIQCCRTPLSEKEEVFAYQDDDPFYSEFAALFDSIESEPRDVDVGRTAGSTDPAATPGRILSTYGDAHKTYEFTWRIRDESERPSGSR